MGKGRQSPTDQTVTQTNIPEYAEPYVRRLFSRAESESQRPYATYQGTRLAPQSSYTNDFYNIVQGLPGLDMGNAYNALGAAGNANEALMGMGPSDFSEFGFSDSGTYLGDTVSDYMSPYMQNVVDVQKARAELDFDRMQAGRDASAVQAGAYGGSRHGVVDALAQEELSRQLAEIQAQGSQDAFTQGSELYERDRQARMSNEQMRAGELGRVQEGLDLSRYNFGQLNATGSELAQQLAGMYGDLGMMEQDAALNRAEAVRQAGESEEQYQQRLYDIQYQDFLRQNNFGRDQLQFYSDIVRGNVRGNDTTQTLLQQTNPFRDAVGAGLAGLGLQQAGIFG